MSGEVAYCIVCGVSLDLHPDEEATGFACGIAARRAELLEQMIPRRHG